MCDAKGGKALNGDKQGQLLNMGLSGGIMYEIKINTKISQGLYYVSSTVSPP
jgi:hypothetical protein